MSNQEDGKKSREENGKNVFFIINNGTRWQESVQYNKYSFAVRADCGKVGDRR